MLLAKTDVPDPRLPGTIHTAATAAVQNLLGGDTAMEKARTPEIVADAAVEILARPARECTGNTFIDVDVLREAGVTYLSGYGGTGALEYDIVVDPPA